MQNQTYVLGWADNRMMVRQSSIKYPNTSQVLNLEFFSFSWTGWLTKIIDPIFPIILPITDAFPKGTRMKWNTNQHVQNSNMARWIHFWLDKCCDKYASARNTFSVYGTLHFNSLYMGKKVFQSLKSL